MLALARKNVYFVFSVHEKTFKNLETFKNLWCIGCVLLVDFPVIALLTFVLLFLILFSNVDNVALFLSPG